MGFVEALFYSSIAYFLMPKTREEVPFKQMGYDLDQFILFFAEIGLYEASVFELYKGLVCIFDQDYGYSKMYCSAPAAIASEEDDEEAGAEKLDDRK